MRLSNDTMSAVTGTDCLACFDTEQTADCVETSPLCPDTMCCATYQLDKESGLKSGRVFAFRINTDRDTAHGDSDIARASGSSGSISSSSGGGGGVTVVQPGCKPLLALEHELDMPAGVLDMKFSRRCAGPHDDVGSTPHLALALSNGSVEIVRIPAATMPSQIERVAATPVQAASALSLDWDYDRGGDGGAQLSVSGLLGGMAVWEFGDSGGRAADGGQMSCRTGVGVGAGGGNSGNATGPLRLLHRWQAHALCDEPTEVWISAFSRSSQYMLYTGADDGLFKLWDLRLISSSSSGGMESGGTAGKPLRAALTSTEHRAGVCSMACHPFREHVLATGSYDEMVRVWDERALGHGPVAQCDVGGGVWRLKWHPARARADWLLAACMRGQARLLRLDVQADGGSGDRDGGCKETQGGGGGEGGAGGAGGRGGEKEGSSGGAVERAAASARSVATIDTSVLYPGHEPEELTYGADWLRTGQNCDSACPAVATCSFYDHSLHVWRPAAAAALATTASIKGEGSLSHQPQKARIVKPARPSVSALPPVPALVPRVCSSVPEAVSATVDEDWCNAAATILDPQEGTSAYDEEEISTLESIVSAGLRGVFDDISSSSDEDGRRSAGAAAAFEPYDGRASPLLPHDETALAAALADLGFGAEGGGTACGGDIEGDGAAAPAASAAASAAAAATAAAVPPLLVPQGSCSDAGFAAACNGMGGNFGARKTDGSMGEIADALQGLNMFTPKQLRAENWQLGLPDGAHNEQEATTIAAVAAAGAADAETQGGCAVARAAAVLGQRGKPNLALLRRAAEQAARQEAEAVAEIRAVTALTENPHEAADEEYCPPGTDGGGIFDGITSSDDDEAD